jgi:sec-independent protein translocase protein TatB
MMPDTIFIFLLALVIFGPKKLPEIGRQVGKLVGDLRKASNEFKMQIEDELRNAERADREKKLAAQSAAPSTDTPAAVVEARELPAPLAAQPPSTGTIESAENPYRVYSPNEEESLPQNESLERTAVEPVPEASEPQPAPLTVRPPSTGTIESAENPYRVYSPNEEESLPQNESLERTAVEPVPEASEPRPALEEQPTNHHG